MEMWFFLSAKHFVFFWCCEGILPFLLCLLKLKPLFYSENQIKQKAVTAAASMVVVATAESTKLETILGAQEEVATQHDQMHMTHEKVMTCCWCEIDSSSLHVQAASIVIMGLNHHFFTPSVYSSNRKLPQNLSQTLCHLSSFHCHFSFLTFKLSWGCY